MNLTIFLKVTKISACFLCLTILSSCCFFSEEQTLTPFPPRAAVVEYSTNPVKSFDKEAKTYIVTSEMMENMVLDRYFINEVLKWKRENGVK